MSAAAGEGTHPHRGHKVMFKGYSGNRLVASWYDADVKGVPTALLLHGGGQTRHAWNATAAQLAGAGFTAIALDQRGHGDSDWLEDGSYSFADYAHDASVVADEIAAKTGRRPVVIGASLGGISSLLALGERADVFAGLVMVDITPMMRQEGLDGIHNFMQAKSREGFASPEEASEAIAAYLPHRPRPKSLDGLKKNLRLRDDGRYYWHWDPRFSEGVRSVNSDRAVQIERMREAARGLKVPVILVRGRSSELVGDEEAADFQALCPQAEYADIAGARHMVAGDKNDVFARKVLDFMTRHFK